MRMYFLLAFIAVTLAIVALFIFRDAIPRTFIPKQFIVAKGTLRDNVKPFFGTITEIKGNIYEVKNTDGSKAKIILTSNTKFMNGKKEDMQKDQKVSGIGKETEDDTIEVKEIEVNPQSRLQSNPINQ